MEEQAYFYLIKKAGFEKIRIVARHSLPNGTGRNGFLPRPRIRPTSRKRGSGRRARDGNEHQVHCGKTAFSTIKGSSNEPILPTRERKTVAL